MKRLNLLLLLFTVLIQNCNGQTPPKEIHNDLFNWTIILPENFENVSKDDWAKMGDKGAAAIEETYDTKVEARAETIFVFKSDDLNYFEANYQPFDTAVDGDYLESCRNVNDVLYQTSLAQMQGVTIDTSTSVEKIDQLEFQTFKMKIKFPNKMVMRILMYSRLFGNKEFTVNIMYVDEAKGEQMLKSWLASKFGK